MDSRFDELRSLVEAARAADEAGEHAQAIGLLVRIRDTADEENARQHQRQEALEAYLS
jgi:hypothetical protein